MFKLLILQSLYSLSDDQMEYQITDILSFKRFLGLKYSDRVPDSKTIWKFRETSIQEGVIDALFYRFNQALDDQSIFAKTGQIFDPGFVEDPRQRSTYRKLDDADLFQIKRILIFLHNILVTEISKNTSAKSTEKGTNSGMYYGKAGIGAECKCKYFDCGLSDLRNLSLAVCKGSGMTAACIVNHFICTGEDLGTLIRSLKNDISKSCITSLLQKHQRTPHQKAH